jgi:short-subunit dehydrogenase
MTDFPYGTALIVGAGPGISASLARQLSARGVKVALAARSVDKLKGVANDTYPSLRSSTMSPTPWATPMSSSTTPAAGSAVP